MHTMPTMPTMPTMRTIYRRTTPVRAAAALSLVLVASLAACSDGDIADERADETTAVEPTTGPGDTTIDTTLDAMIDGPDTADSTAADDAADSTAADDAADDAADGASDDTAGETADDTADDTANGAIVLPVVDELDPDEVAGLLWMREEEQLAHDVYVALGEEYGLRVFENISRSEQQHIDMTIALLDRYDVPDIAAGNAPGTFTDPRMQELYDDLIARGMQSKIDALVVGATIEELDIADLRARAEITDEPEIDDVYARLERASGNHLRAFVGQLDLLEVAYEPTVLDDVEEIVAAPMQRGRRGDH